VAKQKNNSSSMPQTDFIETFSEALTEAATGSVAKFIEEETKDALANAGIAAVLASASAEFAKTATEHLLGPILKIFLRLIDPTQQKLDEIRDGLAAVLGEPLETGVRLANFALTVKVVSEGDRLLRNENLYAAISALEKAYSYAARSKLRGDDRIRIRLTQALIAKALDAPGFVAKYLDDFLTTLRMRKINALSEFQEATQNLERVQFRASQEGRSELLALRNRMLEALGPIPDISELRGQYSRDMSHELVFAMRQSDWREKENEIIKKTEPPGDHQIDLLRANVESARAHLQKLQAFEAFWQFK
jgi:hypothetical protein